MIERSEFYLFSCRRNVEVPSPVEITNVKESVILVHAVHVH